MKPLRLYADTSVFGGYFDEEFAEDTKRLFGEIESGRFVLLISTTTADELRVAPERVRKLLADLPVSYLELVPDDPRIQTLRDAYITEGVVGSASLRDAEHHCERLRGGRGLDRKLEFSPYRSL